MPTYLRQIGAAFGPDYAGLASKVLYTVFDASGTNVLGPSGAGVVESTGSPGLYLVALNFDQKWSGRVEWTITGVSGVGAVDDFGRILGGYSVAVASFGADTSGQAGNIGVTVYDTGGNLLVTRQTAGIAESANLPGVYWLKLFLASGWSGYLQWDVSGRFGLVAVEEFGTWRGPGQLRADHRAGTTRRATIAR